MGKSLAEVLKQIQPLDKRAMLAARRRQDQLTKPLGSLGRLEELSIKVAGIRGETLPRLEHKAIITMAADHGVVAQGVSLYPQEVTAQMVQNFLLGGAGINVLANHIGARVVVVDMGVAAELPHHPHLLSLKIAPGTRDMTQGPAMSREEVVCSLEAGIAVVEMEIERGLDILGTGDMGIGNTTASSALCAVFTGQPVEKITGRGTGIGKEQWAHKVEVIRRALEMNRPDSKDPLDVLAKVGGFEIGGLAGVMLGGAAHRIPVVVDGFISGAAALIACALAPQAKEYLIASHRSAEMGHRAILRHLGLKPLLDLGMRLGEGTGAALGIAMVEAATKILREMATFAQAGVSEAAPPLKEG